MINHLEMQGFQRFREDRNGRRKGYSPSCPLSLPSPALLPVMYPVLITLSLLSCLIQFGRSCCSHPVMSIGCEI